jgi:CRISPR/Cas system-associated exonuclease Cas4 (RecB family)
MEDVNLDINKISLSKDSAVSIMTLHRSKGLEYKHVIVAGLSQENLMSKKHGGFKLPQKIEHILEAKDTAAAKRELYVAITRAKEDCTITYHVNSASGSASSMAHILEDVGVDNFDFTTKEENEKMLLQKGHDIFLKYTKAQIKSKIDSLKEIINFVSENYTSCVVSVSLLNNFYECPRKWYFRNFLKLPEVKSTSLALGSIVHAGIEEILKTKALFNEKTILSFVKEESGKQGLIESTKNQKDFNNIIKTASEIIISWQEHDYPGLKSKYESEKSVSITDKNFPNLKIYGKLDLVEYDKDIVYVTDFKTGSVKTKNDIEKEKDGRYSSLMRQLAMYGYLMHNSGSASTIFTKLIFLEDFADGKNRTYGVSINNEHVDILVKDIKDYENSIINGDWVTASCSGDYFNKKEPCEYCKKFYKIFA